MTVDSTNYAVGYSDFAFRLVKPGMGPEEVESILGKPLGQYPTSKGTEVAWCYSRRDGDTNYRERAIIFLRGHVVRKASSFYLD
jgi:hypothetical protein